MIIDGLIDSPLAPVVKLWTSKLEKAREHKDGEFGKVARECWRFFHGNHAFMYDSPGDGVGLRVDEGVKTKFRMTLNKVAELVQLFGPALYYRNPHRQVNPRKPQVPDLLFEMMGGQNPQAAQSLKMQIGINAEIDAARSELLAWYLNYTPNELKLKEHSRSAIDEGLVKGRGCLWHEIHMPPGSSTIMPRSFFDSVDNLLIDPDATSLDDAQWIARRCIHPRHIVAREYDVPERDLRPGQESMERQSIVETHRNGRYFRAQGATHDLVTYWKVWSKSGLGQNLKGSAEDEDRLGGMLDERHRALFDEFGDNVFLVLCEDCPYPLNLPPEILDLDITAPENVEKILGRVRWPIPFWADEDGWPVSVLDFHPLPGHPWPQAHMTPGLGELKFLNWAFSFLADHIHGSVRTLVAYNEALESDVIEAVEHGSNMSFLALKKHISGAIKDNVDFLQFPSVNEDIWKIIAAIMDEFNKRTGLTELMYGMANTQSRSATDAQTKREMLSVRPDDMAERVESWQTLVSRREAQIARWFVRGQHVAPVFGERHDPASLQIGPLSRMWDELVSVPLDPMDSSTLESVVREFEYRIEAGSIRKPNRDRDVANMDQAIQTLYQPLFAAYQATGDPTQVNALISDWAKSRDLDATPYLLKPLQPPQPQGALPPPQ